MKKYNIINIKKVKAMVVALTFLSLSAVAQKQADTLAQQLHVNDTQRLQWWRDARFGLFLRALPAHGFKVAVFPLKIKGALIAPARVVAIMDEK